MRERIQDLINRLPEITLAQWIVSFLAIVAVRAMLEYISTPNLGQALLPDLHSFLVSIIFMFLFPTFGFIAILQVGARLSFNTASKLALLGLPSIWLAPIIDMLLYAGRGPGMTYLFTGAQNFVYGWLSFGGPLTSPGITIGLRVEVAIVCVAVFLFVQAITHSSKRALLAALTGYTLIYIVAILPSILVVLLTPLNEMVAVSSVGTASTIYTILVSLLAKSLPLRNLVDQALGTGFDDRTVYTIFIIGLGQFFWFVTSIFLLIVAWLQDRASLQSLLGNVRPERLAHYWLLVLGGTLLAVSGHIANVIGSAADIMVLVTLLLVFAGAWLFAVTDNDLADVASDTISNVGRPLVSGSIKPSLYRAYRLCLLLWTLAGAYTLGYTTFFLVGLAMLLAHIYSSEPLRFKRIPIISTACIGLASLATFSAGYCLWTKTADFTQLPTSVALAIILSFTLAAQVKDIKDYKGDLATGTITLPTIFGQELGRKIILALIALVIVFLTAFFHTTAFIVAAIPAGVLLYVLGKIAGKILDKHYFYSYILYGLCVFILFVR